MTPSLTGSGALLSPADCDSSVGRMRSPVNAKSETALIIMENTTVKNYVQHIPVNKRQSRQIVI